MKALLVDDEKDICDILEFKLNLLGFKCHSAYTGNEAIDLCKETDYDLIISDIRMPEGSGIDLIDFLKTKNTKLPAIIFLTGHTVMTESQLKELGVLEILEKPIDFEKLLSCVKQKIL